MEFSKEEMMEIMAVFKAESEEHLKTLHQKMAELSVNTTNATAIEVLHRTSHSMKGAARMLGLTPIEEIGRMMEDGFKAAKEGKPILTPGNMTALHEAVEGMHKLIEQLASQGTVDGIDVSGILKKLESFK